MRTWRKQWPPEAWHPLLTSLLAARDALSVVGVGSRPFPLGLLRAYDDEGQQRDIALDSAVIDSVEYDLHAPGVASPLSEYFGDAGSEPSRRRMAVAVLRNLMSWERSGLAYRAMRPDGLVHADGRVYCDLLRWVATLDRESRWRMRCGAAACLVFLLSPWPYAWPAVLGGTMPALHERADERSAWGIAESAVTMLLDEHIDPVRVEVALTDKADLLDAAALLDHRFPAWPAGLAREVFA